MDSPEEERVEKGGAAIEEEEEDMADYHTPPGLDACSMFCIFFFTFCYFLKPPCVLA